MKRFLLLCSILSLAACSTVETGLRQSGETSAERVGELKSVVARPGGGTIWEYSSGPQGTWVFLTEFDASGKYVSSRQMRTTP